MSMGLPELLIILAIVIVLFGARRLPDIGSGLAGAIKGFRKGISEDEHSGDDKDGNDKAEGDSPPPDKRDKP